MISRFVNRFKRSDLDEQRGFQQKVHGFLAEIYPDKKFDVRDDPLTLESKGIIYGLTNLRSNFLLSSHTDAELKELIKNQFDGILAGVVEADRNDVTWDEAKGRLMPQLMPEEFLHTTPLNLVHRPLPDGVILAFVLDSEASYSFVSTTDCDRWNIDYEAVSSEAFKNLNERSKGIEMAAFPGENAFFVINTMDGFDAVRILLPEMQDVIAEHIGLPFYAGVPNRDFLICWSKNGDNEFLENMRSQVAKDSEERPYPLSGKVFEVRDNGSIELASIGEPDPKASSAELN